jgi:glycosyltransferase involved in cell wall biosynthesis
MRRRIDRWAGVDGPFRRWWIDGVTTAGVGVGDVDLVYASMSPFESGEAAAGLARSLGCPWVADLRDPWALDEVAVYPTRLHRARELRRMRHVLAQADAVIMNTPEATRQLVARLPEIDPTQVHTIPNGFDREDFDDPEPTGDERAFRIVHAGYLHTELGHRLRRGQRLRRRLGGFEVDVDLVARSHVYLLAAVEQVIESNTAGLPIEVPPMHDLPEGVRATIVPGKTYEYLASGRPILAAVPDGDARDLLGQAPTARLCRPADTAEMADVIRDLAARRATGRMPTHEPDAVAPFERRLLTERLVETFDSVAGARACPALGAVA